MEKLLKYADELFALNILLEQVSVVMKNDPKIILEKV